MDLEQHIVTYSLLSCQVLPRQTWKVLANRMAPGYDRFGIELRQTLIT